MPESYVVEPPVIWRFEKGHLFLFISEIHGAERQFLLSLELESERGEGIVTAVFI